MKKTLTQELQEEAQQKIDIFKKVVDEINQRHEEKGFSKEDESYYDARKELEKYREMMFKQRKAIQEKYWQPSDCYGGSGYANGELVKRFEKEGYGIDAIKVACDDLVKKEIKELENSQEYKELEKKKKEYEDVAHNSMSKEHWDIHNELEDAERELSFWKNRIRNLGDKSFVQQMGRDRAERKRYEDEKKKIENEADEIKKKLTGGK